jgi:hypothetical protein
MVLGKQMLLLISTVAYLVVFFALGSGLFNSIIEGTSTARTFIVQNRSFQTLGETIVTTMILFIGMAGIFLIYMAGNSISLKNQGGLLVAGFVTIGIALLLGFRLVDIKMRLG